MNCLFLTLKGGIRSWGVTSIGDDRWTGLWPTESAVLGLAGACMGVDRHCPEQVTAWYNGFLICTLSAVSYWSPVKKFTQYHPSMLSDLQTTKNSLNMSGKRRKDTIMSHRGYITDGLDVAAIIPVHNDAEDWLKQLVFAVQQPCFTPYLGRRSNSLSGPLADPGERVMQFSSAGNLCEHLFRRLSKLRICNLHPAESTLRLPVALQDETDDLLAKWDYAGKEVVPDHRPGYLRFFKNRTVLKFRRKGEDQINGIQ